MSVDYQGLLNGNIDPLELAKTLREEYGGDDYMVQFGARGSPGHYMIHFREEYTPEVAALPAWERKNHTVSRMMHVWINGECASDYADVTLEPMTLVSLGRHGQCAEIIGVLIKRYGGFIQDEAVAHEWVAA